MWACRVARWPPPGLPLEKVGLRRGVQLARKQGAMGPGTVGKISRTPRCCLTSILATRMACVTMLRPPIHRIWYTSVVYSMNTATMRACSRAFGGGSNQSDLRSKGAPSQGSRAARPRAQLLRCATANLQPSPTQRTTNTDQYHYRFTLALLGILFPTCRYPCATTLAMSISMAFSHTLV